MTLAHSRLLPSFIVLTGILMVGTGMAQEPDQSHTPSPAMPVVEILIQDNLVPAVNNEIEGLRSLIRSLPPGSRVLTAYITAGSLAVTQDFTSDRNRAAASLRVLRGVGARPYSPFVGLREGLKRFDSQPQTRRVVLLISDGLDTSRGFEEANPGQSLGLDQSIREAQRRRVAVYSFFAPEIGAVGPNRVGSLLGSGSLKRLAGETGGKTYGGGMSVVSFSPYIRDFRNSLGAR
jgi:hypothetical protein